MSADREIDVEQLRTELDQIKDAMGLRERSPGTVRIWLVFGLLVPVAAALSQYVYSQRLPQSYHGVIWLGLLGVGGAVGAWYVFEDWPGDFQGKPNLAVQFGVVYAAVFAIQTLSAPFLRSLSYVEESMYTLGLVLVLLGVAYAVLGSSLRAFYIRRRDRLPFYLGGLWMVALGVAIPYSDLLMEWAYAVFGGVYFGYALGTYAVLRGDEA